MPSEISVVYNCLNQLEREDTCQVTFDSSNEVAVTNINSSTKKTFMDSFIWLKLRRYSIQNVMKQISTFEATNEMRESKLNGDSVFVTRNANCKSSSGTKSVSFIIFWYREYFLQPESFSSLCMKKLAYIEI